MYVDCGDVGPAFVTKLSITWASGGVVVELEMFVPIPEQHCKVLVPIKDKVEKVESQDWCFGWDS